MPPSRRTRVPRGTGTFTAPWPIGKVPHAREPRLGDEAPEDLPEGEVPVLILAVREVAERQPRDPIEDPREPEMGPHPVDPVRLLSDVLEEQDRAREVRQPRRAQESGDEGEVSSKQRPSATPPMIGVPATGAGWSGAVLQEREEPLHDPWWLGAELRDDRAVHAHAPRCLERRVQRRDVGEADEQLRRGRRSTGGH